MITFYAFVVTFLLGAISGTTILALYCLNEARKEENDIVEKLLNEDLNYGPRSTILKYTDAN